MRQILSLASVIGFTLALSGCAGLSLPKLTGKPEIARATTENPVMDVLSIWQPADGRGPDDLPSRGFAGQLMFFTYRSDSPALVDGDVTVAVFEDTTSRDDQSEPLWERTFTAAEWNCFATQTNLGVAYQLFVPYVRKGRHEAHCELRVVFDPADGGPPIFSKLTKVVLPGDKSALSKSTLRRERIEPQRSEAATAASLQTNADLDRHRSRGSMRETTLTLPGQRRVPADAAARLHELAREMVLEQQQGQGDIQQAGYTTESPAASEGELAPSGRRYRLQ